MHGYDFWSICIPTYIIVAYCFLRGRKHLLRRRKRLGLKELEQRSLELEMKTGLVFDKYGNLQDGYDLKPWTDYLNTLSNTAPSRRRVGATYKHKLPTPTNQRSPYGMATLITRRTPEEDKELKALYRARIHARGGRVPTSPTLYEIGFNPYSKEVQEERRGEAAFLEMLAKARAAKPNPLGLDEPINPNTGLPYESP